MLDARNVTAIVVTYNRLPLLKQCLAALRAQTVQGFTVLLVDNASTDGTADYIKTLAMPGLVCRNPGKNLGGAGGFAYGIRAAAELGCEAVWIMDDDTLPEPDALAALLAAAVLVFLIGYILVMGIPNLKPELFAWEYNSENVSLTPALINTVLMTAFSLAISTPLGIFAAIWLVEYAHRGSKLVKVVRVTRRCRASRPSSTACSVCCSSSRSCTGATR